MFKSAPTVLNYDPSSFTVEIPKNIHSLSSHLPTLQISFKLFFKVTYLRKLCIQILHTKFNCNLVS